MLIFFFWWEFYTEQFTSFSKHAKIFQKRETIVNFSRSRLLCKIGASKIISSSRYNFLRLSLIRPSQELYLLDIRLAWSNRLVYRHRCRKSSRRNTCELQFTRKFACATNVNLPVICKHKTKISVIASNITSKLSVNSTTGCRLTHLQLEGEFTGNLGGVCSAILSFSPAISLSLYLQNRHFCMLIARNFAWGPNVK